jgi:hypothetical protein
VIKENMKRAEEVGREVARGLGVAKFIKSVQMKLTSSLDGTHNK